MITGGAGFIGSNLGDALIDKGYEVHVVDNLSSGKRENLNKNAILHVVDICDYQKLKDIFDNIETIESVFHTAAIPRVSFSIEHPIETNETNVSGTLNVLHAAKEANVKKVIYSASSSAYGDQKTMPLREDAPANPKSPYGLQKYVGELTCKMFSDIYNLPTVCLRYFNVYGPKFNPDGPYALVIGKFLIQRSKGKPMTITGDGNQTRDFTHVSDVVRANILAMESDKVGKGEVINIGGGRNTSMNKLTEIIGGPVEYIPKRLEPRDTLADITKAKRLLGWVPRVKIEDGIKELKIFFI